MNNIRKLTDSLFWVGVNDRRIALFENVYPVPTGMSYNSYVLLDEKTALFDTVDASFTHDFLENVTAALNGRPLDYLIVNHMEPDHCASIADVIAPAFIIIGRKKIALTIVLPLNLRLRSIAINKLKNVISGTSTSILSTDVVSICLKVP